MPLQTQQMGEWRLPCAQVVMYPIVNLRRLGVGARAYVEGLEDAMVRTAGVYGVSARVRLCRFPG